MEKIISKIVTINLFLLLLLSSCEKEAIETNSKNNNLDINKMEIVSDNYELAGSTGSLYLYHLDNGSVQKIFISKEKIAVEWEHTVYTDGNSVTCNGPASNCKIYTDGDGVCIRIKPEIIK